MTRPQRCIGTVSRVAAALAACLLAMAVPAGGARAARGLTAQQVVERVRSALTAIRDARARIEAEAIDGNGRRTRSVVAASLVRQPGVVRLEVLEPAALADQVYVIDFEVRRLSVYLPVTHQIVVQSLDQALPGGADPKRLGPEGMLGDWAPPDADHLSVAAVENRAGRRYYVLEAPAPRAPDRTPTARSGSRAPGVGLPGSGAVGVGGLPFLTADRAAVLRLWVNASTWLVERVVAYDRAGKVVGSVEFRDVQVNTGLRPAELRRLPEDAEVVES